VDNEVLRCFVDDDQEQHDHSSSDDAGDTPFSGGLPDENNPDLFSFTALETPNINGGLINSFALCALPATMKRSWCENIEFCKEVDCDGSFGGRIPVDLHWMTTMNVAHNQLSRR
jgi:hypothetical protein